MKRCTPALVIVCCLGIVTCNFENKADIEVINGSTGFIAEHRAVRDEVTEAVKAVVEAIVPEHGLANAASLTACCWAQMSGHSAAQRDPYHEGSWCNWDNGNWPDRARTSADDSWWNMNYTLTHPNKKHVNVTGSDGGNHWLTLDLGANYNIYGVRYWGRHDQGNSRIQNYEIYVSENAVLGRQMEGGVPAPTPPASIPTTQAPPNWLGHRPPADALVHTGSFSDNNEGQRVTFDNPVYGRYVQIRVITSYNDNGNDGGARWIEADRDTEADQGSVNDRIAAAVSRVLTDGGYTDMTLDLSYLENASEEAAQLAGKVKNHPKNSKLLDNMLNGEFDEDGNLVKKGASQYLTADPPLIAPNLASIQAFFDYQQEIDDFTVLLLGMVSTLKK